MKVRLIVVLLVTLLTSYGIAQSRGISFLPAEKMLQQYVNHIAKKEYKKIPADEYFAGHMRKVDSWIVDSCAKQVCKVVVKAKTRIHQEGKKLTYFSYMKVLDRKGRVIAEPEGCYVIYTDDFSKLRFSAYDGHCDSDN